MRVGTRQRVRFQLIGLRNLWISESVSLMSLRASNFEELPFVRLSMIFFCSRKISQRASSRSLVRSFVIVFHTPTQ